MKKIVSLLVLMLTLFSIENVSAQNDTFGVRAGANYTRSTSTVQNANFSYFWGFHVGAFYTIEKGNCRLQPGMMFFKQGTAHRVYYLGGSEPEEDTALEFNYIEIPLEFSYKVYAFNGGAIRLNVEPHLGFCLKAIYNDHKAKKEELIEVGKKMNDEDMGIEEKNFGVRLGTSLQLGMFEPYIGYDLGLSDIMMGPNDMYMEGLYFGLSLHL
ncbi:MAG: PorT family protein [Prolixibacteraceae bacterium]|jgi:hypothetical protein|nr:PorT family protein [Prolixibacteraceae bacterium]